MNLTEKINIVLNEATVEKRHVSYRGYTFDICHQVPKGYYAKGIGMAKKLIYAYQYFDKIEQAEDHAKLEIDGFLDQNK